MDLLERYLQAVGQYLPAATKADTLAELRANLLAQMDERVEELERPLSEGETADVLRAHGKPELVALRYLPQRSLIGPTLFPFYLFALRKALPLVVLVYAVARAAVLTFAAPLGKPGLAAGSAVVQFVPVLLTFWAVVTGVFAVLEFVQNHYGAGLKWGQWDPAKLLPVVEANGTKQRSLASRTTELVVHCLWMLYVLAVPSHPYLLIWSGALYLDKFSVRWAPVWHTFYIWFIAFLVVQLVVKVLAFSNWTQRWQDPLEVAVRLFGVVPISILVAFRVYYVPTSASANLQKLAVVNLWLNFSFRIVLFMVVVGLLVDAWQRLRHSLPVKRLAF
jgi:hypothetical protein